jgi:prophage regulatory protein
MSVTPEPEDKFLCPAAVEALSSLSRTTIWRLVKRGDFPAPVRLSPGRIGWRRSSLATWMEGRDLCAAASAEAA